MTRRRVHLTRPQAAPTTRNLRAIRRWMTLLFASTTAVCLIVLGFIALHIDDDSRRARVDTETMEQVTRLGARLDLSTGSLNLGGVSIATQLPDQEVFGIISDRRIVLASPNQPSLPSDEDLSTLVATMSTPGQTAHFAFTDSRGFPRRWSASAVPELGRVGAIAIVGGPVLGQSAHNHLAAQIAVTIAALTAAATAFGHVVSGRAMRPAVKSLEQQEQFLAEAAHELRTPMARLKLALEAPDSNSPDDLRSSVDAASTQVDGLIRLTNALLLRAREQSAADTIEMRSMRLDIVASLTVEQFQPPPTVDTTSVPTVMRGNPELISQAIRNLLENAQRYADDSLIHVHVDDTGVSVIDHGPGIPATARSRVLRRGIGAGRGTGSGLSIVSWIAKIHGGSVLLEDTPVGGLTVRLLLPAKKAS